MNPPGFPAALLGHRSGAGDPRSSHPNLHTLLGASWGCGRPRLAWPLLFDAGGSSGDWELAIRECGAGPERDEDRANLWHPAPTRARPTRIRKLSHRVFISAQQGSPPGCLPPPRTQAACAPVRFFWAQDTPIFISQLQWVQLHHPPKEMPNIPLQSVATLGIKVSAGVTQGVASR